MARIRYIKPGIMTNEDLCELGPYAYILFTGLWMLADRDGRLEDRPRRIKIETMGLWDEVTVDVLKSLLKSLAEKGFIHRYTVDDCDYISICKWYDHQHPHPREAPSKIPPPPLERSGSSLLKTRNTPVINKALPRHVQGTAKARSSRVGNGEWGTGNGSGGERKTTGSVEDPPPTPPQPQRKPPASERIREAPPPDEVNLLRESLAGLAHEIQMPPPDDAMVLRILAAGNGAPAQKIHEMLVRLHKRGKFRDMRSWGYIPTVVSQCA